MNDRSVAEARPPHSAEHESALLQRAREQLAQREIEQALHPPQLSTGALLAAGLAALLLAVGWARTFSYMWGDWFPSWHHLHATLYDRLTKGESYYTHGPLVPLVSLVLIIFIYKRVGLPCRRSKSSNMVGGIALGWFLFCQAFAALTDVHFLSGFSFIGVLASLVLLWGGWPMLRAYGLPIGILFFMTPLPEFAIHQLNFRLKLMAADASLYLTNNLFGIPAIRDGATVYLPDGPSGVHKVLTVDNVCGGLRSLISLTFFAALFAMVCRVRGWWRVFLLLMSVPVALLCNIVRITGLNVVAHYYGVDAAREGSTYHDMSGLAVFGVALGILFGLEYLIAFAGRKLHRRWSDSQLMGFLDQIPRFRDPLPRFAPGGGRPAVAFASVVPLALVCALTLFWTYDGGATINHGNQAKKAVPMKIAINGVPFNGEDQVMDTWTMDILRTTDAMCRFYTDPQNNRIVALTMVFSPSNRKGTHPPEVCLEGSGDRIISTERHQITGNDGKAYEMQELVTQSGNGMRTFHAYVYKCGDTFTASFVKQQLVIVWNGLWSRNSSGALIRFSTVVPRDQALDQTRELTLGAARALLPEIERNLP